MLSRELNFQAKKKEEEKNLYTAHAKKKTLLMKYSELILFLSELIITPIQAAIQVLTRNIITMNKTKIHMIMLLLGKTLPPDLGRRPIRTQCTPGPTPHRTDTAGRGRTTGEGRS